MLVISETFQINFSRKSGVTGIGTELHLEAESHIIRSVRIFQIFNRAFRSLAGSVKKHDGSSRFSIYLFYKMRRLLHAVPVNIENHLN